MDRSVETEIKALDSMTPRGLRGKWRDVFGEETRTGNRQYLIKRLAWRIQANAEGDLTAPRLSPSGRHSRARTKAC